MNKKTCCGNCKHFKFEDAEGYGFCELISTDRSCEWSCPNHNLLKRKKTRLHSKSLNDGWTEITPDTESYITDEIADRVVIGWIDSSKKQQVVAYADCAMGIGTMAKIGGYYYYILPELNIE